MIPVTSDLPGHFSRHHPASTRRGRLLPALLLALVLTSGCATPRYGLDSCSAASAGEETVTSLRYRVRSDAGKPAAYEVSRFMERAAALWTPLLGVPDPLALPLEVRLHRDPEDLAALLSSRQLTAGATGLYLPLPPTPAIHVACQGAEPGHPYRTLLHEGTHQFIHLGAGYRVPRQPPATPPRLTLPLWLNEGLASYYETAFVTPDLLQTGHPDPARLAELQEALRRGQVPALGRTFNKRYGEPFASLDYAIAWGVVYALMQEAPPPWAAGGREWLKALIDEARLGWPTPAGPAAADGGILWWKVVTDRTYAALVKFAAERGLTMADWEAHWRSWVLSHP